METKSGKRKREEPIRKEQRKIGTMNDDVGDYLDFQEDSLFQDESLLVSPVFTVNLSQSVSTNSHSNTKRLSSKKIRHSNERRMRQQVMDSSNERSESNTSVSSPLRVENFQSVWQLDTSNCPSLGLGSLSSVEVSEESIHVAGQAIEPSATFSISKENRFPEGCNDTVKNNAGIGKSGSVTAYEDHLRPYDLEKHNNDYQQRATNDKRQIISLDKNKRQVKISCAVVDDCSVLNQEEACSKINNNLMTKRHDLIQSGSGISSLSATTVKASQLHLNLSNEAPSEREEKKGNNLTQIPRKAKRDIDPEQKRLEGTFQQQNDIHRVGIIFSTEYSTLLDSASSKVRESLPNVISDKRIEGQNSSHGKQDMKLKATPNQSEQDGVCETSQQQIDRHSNKAIGRTVTCLSSKSDITHHYNSNKTNKSPLKLENEEEKKNKLQETLKGNAIHDERRRVSEDISRKWGKILKELTPLKSKGMGFLSPVLNTSTTKLLFEGINKEGETNDDCSNCECKIQSDSAKVSRNILGNEDLNSSPKSTKDAELSLTPALKRLRSKLMGNTFKDENKKNENGKSFDENLDEKHIKHSSMTPTNCNCRDDSFDAIKTPLTSKGGTGLNLTPALQALKSKIDLYSSDEGYTTPISTETVHSSSKTSSTRRKSSTQFEEDDSYLAQPKDLSSARKKLTAQSSALVERLRGASQRRKMQLSRSRDSFAAKEQKHLMTLENDNDDLVYSPDGECEKIDEESEGNEDVSFICRKSCHNFKARPLPVTNLVESGGHFGVPKVAKRPTTTPLSPLLGIRRIKKVESNLGEPFENRSSNRKKTVAENPPNQPLITVGSGGHFGVPKVAKRPTTTPLSPLLGIRRIKEIKSNHRLSNRKKVMGESPLYRLITRKISSRTGDIEACDIAGTSELKKRPMVLPISPCLDLKLKNIQPRAALVPTSSIEKGNVQPKVVTQRRNTEQKVSNSKAQASTIRVVTSGSFTCKETGFCSVKKASDIHQFGRVRSTEALKEQENISPSMPFTLHSTIRAEERAKFDAYRLSNEKERHLQKVKERESLIKGKHRELSRLKESLR